MCSPCSQCDDITYKASAAKFVQSFKVIIFNSSPETWRSLANYTRAIRSHPLAGLVG